MDPVSSAAGAGKKVIEVNSAVQQEAAAQASKASDSSQVAPVKETESAAEVRLHTEQKEIPTRPAEWKKENRKPDASRQQALDNVEKEMKEEWVGSETEKIYNALAHYREVDASLGKHVNREG